MCYQAFCDFNFYTGTYSRFELLLLCNFEILFFLKKIKNKKKVKLPFTCGDYKATNFATLFVNKIFLGIKPLN